MRILPLIQVDAAKKSLVGDKAYSLACLTQGKFPIPEGYVITTQAFDEFLNVNEIRVSLTAEFDKIDLSDLHSVDYASRQLQALIRYGEFPPDLQTEILQQFTHINSDFVAIRSSAVTEDGGTLWTGELPSYLHIPADELLNYVKKCWEGLFSTRSLYYLVKESVDPQSLKMAVIIQKMVDADISGRVYCSHPVTLDSNQMVIEATFGFMEKDGAENPPFDTYIIQKVPFRILDKKIKEQDAAYVSGDVSGITSKEIEENRSAQKLSDKQIDDLVKLAVRVEQSCGRDTEIEWIFKDEFYLVQTRQRGD